MKKIDWELVRNVGRRLLVWVVFWLVGLVLVSVGLFGFVYLMWTHPVVAFVLLFVAMVLLFFRGNIRRMIAVERDKLELKRGNKL